MPDRRPERAGSAASDVRADDSDPAADGAPPRAPWQPPRLEELPPLTDLTLQSGSSIHGTQSVFP